MSWKRVVFGVAGVGGVAGVVSSGVLWWYRSHNTPSSFCPRYPIVLCHGFCGWQGEGATAYFRGVAEWLEDERNCVVITTKVQPLSSIHARAEQLAQQVRLYVQEMRQEKGQEKMRVNLVCHSMAGLDARVAVHMLLQDNEVASITTISTPHLGSPLALSLHSLHDINQWFGLDLQGYSDLSPQHMKDFSAQHPDVPHVLYLSVAGSQQVTFPHPLWIPQQIINAETGQKKNDGLVTVESATHGTFLGEFPDLNHYSEIGWLVADTSPHLHMYDTILKALVARKC